ncbi:MAG: penicillin-binding protein 2, partial [Smithellaceae bacterium]|nr:penicillin-binding protein 2 [Smithellaceae bacterium]
ISRAELDRLDPESYSVGDIIGKFGIEKYLDSFLRGKAGAEQVEVNVLGKEVRSLGKIEPQAGYKVVLTIDSLLQKVASDNLKGRTGSVVALDPRDGSILAMASSPSFDANMFTAGISHENWRRLANDPLRPMQNRAIAGQYPPGSTYKMIVAAAALQEGLITPETKFYCNGSYTLGNRTYHCWQKKGHGMVDLHRALVESCDVYFYNVGRLLGVDRLAYYARSFGLGAMTGVDLPQEKRGLIPTKKWKEQKFRIPWQLGETISLSIGQGFNSLTPLQLADAYAATANGGIVYRPWIIKRIETTDGKVFRSFGPQEKGRVPVSKRNFEIVNKGLWGVVNERGGTGYVLKRAEMDVCGKTGTAQVIGLPDDKSRRRRIITGNTRDHALFVCFAPYKQPEIVVAVIIEHGGHGGAAAAPVARRIIDTYFSEKKAKLQGKVLTQESLPETAVGLTPEAEQGD